MAILTSVDASEPVGGNPPRGRGGVGRTVLIDILANVAKQAIAKFPPDYAPSTDAQLVSDYWKLNGTWQLTAISPSITGQDASIDAKVRIRLSEFIFSSNRDTRQSLPPGNSPMSILSALDLHSPRLSVSVDQSKSPKLINLSSSIPRTLYEAMNPRPNNDSEMVNMRAGDAVVVPLEGVYELSDDTLVIQISKSGQPKPEKIGGGDDDIPKDQFKLEFKRVEPSK